MKKPYLVQRGNFKNIALDKITGIDSLISFQYMGSAEFEFGSLPESLHRIVDLLKNEKLNYFGITIKGIDFCIFGNITENNCEDLIPVFEMWSDKSLYKYNTKEFPYLDTYFEKKTDKHCYTDFWWDIENDWFLFPVDRLESVETAIVKLKEKWS